MTDTIQETIKNIIENNDVVLFMKGTADFPKCGFSAKVAAILQHLGVNFKDVDVLRPLSEQQARGEGFMTCNFVISMYLYSIVHEALIYSSFFSICFKERPNIHATLSKLSADKLHVVQDSVSKIPRTMVVS